MKGFTLIELLAVIIVIGIVALITLPIITNSISNSKENAYNIQIEQIKTAAKDLMTKDLSTVPSEGNSMTIYIGELKRKGLLPIKMLNSKTQKTISNESSVVITRINNSYTYEVNIIDLEENSVQNDNSPIIRLNGSYIEYVEINTEYIEQGAQAFTSNDAMLNVEAPQIKLNDVEVGSIDTSKLNTYKLIYSVTDNGLTTTSVRTVVIRDTISPTIIIPDETQLKVSEVNGYDVDIGVYAVDNSNENIEVLSESTLSNVPGKYIILYSAKDSSGNESTKKRIITVIED